MTSRLFFFIFLTVKVFCKFSVERGYTYEETIPEDVLVNMLRNQKATALSEKVDLFVCGYHEVDKPIEYKGDLDCYEKKNGQIRLRFILYPSKERNFNEYGLKILPFNFVRMRFYGKDTKSAFFDLSGSVYPLDFPSRSNHSQDLRDLYNFYPFWVINKKNGMSYMKFTRKPFEEEIAEEFVPIFLRVEEILKDRKFMLEARLKKYKEYCPGHVCPRFDKFYDELVQIAEDNNFVFNSKDHYCGKITPVVEKLHNESHLFKLFFDFYLKNVLGVSSGDIGERKTQILRKQDELVKLYGYGVEMCYFLLNILEDSQQDCPPVSRHCANVEEFFRDDITVHDCLIITSDRDSDYTSSSALIHLKFDFIDTTDHNMYLYYKGERLTVNFKEIKNYKKLKTVTLTHNNVKEVIEIN